MLYKSNSPLGVISLDLRAWFSSSVSCRIASRSIILYSHWDLNQELCEFSIPKSLQSLSFEGNNWFFFSGLNKCLFKGYSHIQVTGLRTYLICHSWLQTHHKRMRSSCFFFFSPSFTEKTLRPFCFEKERWAGKISSFPITHEGWPRFGLER